MSTLKVDGIRSNSATSDAITLASDGTCTANITNNLSNRNLIINGAMQVAQRATSATAEGYATVDRFSLHHGGENEDCTQARHALTSSDTGPWEEGFRHSYHIQNGNQTGGGDAGDFCYIRQKIENQNMASSGWNYTSASSYITLSFWIKSSVAFNSLCYAQTYTGTDYGYPFETGNLSANTWTKITKTIPGNSNLVFDANNDQGFLITWGMYWGSSFTDNSTSLNTWSVYDSAERLPDMAATWWETDNATFEITGVQLEVSDHATSFEHLSYGDTLAKCQRYYYKHAFGTAEAGSSNVSNNNMAVGMCAMYTGTAGFGFIPYPVTMRTLPSLLKATGTDYYRVYANGGADNFNDISTQQFGINGSVINYYDSFSRTQGHAGWIQIYNTNGYIAFNAEL